MKNNFIIPEPYIPVIAKVLPDALEDNEYKQMYLDKYYDESKRYTLLSGGRGCWKTSFQAFFCAYATMSSKDHNVLFLRYTLTSAKETIANDLLESMEYLGIRDLFTISKVDGFKIVNNKTGNYILIRGVKASSLNQTANVKGLNKFRSVLIDEAEEFVNEHVFDKLDGSIRKAGLNNIIIALNPCIRSHWIYKRWIKYTKKIKRIESANIEVSTSDDVLHVHPSYHDIPKNYLGSSWIQQQLNLKTKNINKYNHLILGEWVDVQTGAVFNFSTFKYMPSDGAFCLGLDIGSKNPTALVLACLNEDRLYLQQLYYKANTSFQERIDKIVSISRKYNKLPLIGDHHLDTKKELANYGIDLIYANKNVEKRIDLMKDLEIYIHEESYDLIEEFAKYHIPEGSEKPKKVDDHTVDASGYAFMYLHKNYNTISTTPSQRPKKVKRLRSRRWNTN